MALPTLRRKQENLKISEAATLINKDSLSLESGDPSQPGPCNNTFEVEDSPLNDSLLMLVDLAHEIQVTNLEQTITKSME